MTLRDEVDSILKGGPGRSQSLRKRKEQQANWRQEGVSVAVQRPPSVTLLSNPVMMGKKKSVGKRVKLMTLFKFFLRNRVQKGWEEAEEEMGNRKHQSVTKSVTQNKIRL